VLNILGDIRGRAFWVVFGCLVVQMGLGYGYVFATLAGDVIGEFGWSRTQWSSRAGMQMFVTAFASPLVGTLCVRWGTRGVVSASAILLGLTFALYGGMGTLWHLYALTPLLGLALTGIGDVAVGGVVPQWVARSRGLALGIVYTGANIGGFILTRVAATIADATSWRTAFVALGFAGAVVILPFAFFAIREPRSGEGVRAGEGVQSGKGASQADPETGKGSAASSIGSDSDLNLSEAMRTRSFWILAFALFSCFFYFVGMIDHMVLFLTDTGFSRAEAVKYFSWSIAMGLGSKIGFGFIADRMSHRTAMFMNTGVFAAAALLTLAIEQPYVLPVFIAVYGFTAAARDVIFPLVVADCFGVRYLAQIYGMLTVTLWPGGALGPLFAAWIHDQLGSYDVAFTTFAGLNAAACLLLLGLRREVDR